MSIDMPHRGETRAAYATRAGHAPPPQDKAGEVWSDRPEGWVSSLARLAEAHGHRNPLPVGVAMVPVGGGLLLIRRAGRVAHGELALPGGYLEMDETWRDGISRELREETGIEAESVELFHVATSRNGNLQVFGLVRPRSPVDVDQLKPTPEALSYEVVTAPRSLRFSTHEEALAMFFARATPPDAWRLRAELDIAMGELSAMADRARRRDARLTETERARREAVVRAEVAIAESSLLRKELVTHRRQAMAFSAIAAIAGRFSERLGLTTEEVCAELTLALAEAENEEPQDDSMVVAMAHAAASSLRESDEEKGPRAGGDDDVARHAMSSNPSHTEEQDDDQPEG